MKQREHANERSPKLEQACHPFVIARLRVVATQEDCMVCGFAAKWMLSGLLPVMVFDLAARGGARNDEQSANSVMLRSARKVA
jgi:hypothetical protein